MTDHEARLAFKRRVWNTLLLFGAHQSEKDAFMANWPRCTEFRFQGEFGFGGKVWAPRTDYGFVKVTMYGEDSTSTRKARLEELNGLLATIPVPEGIRGML